MKIALSLNFVAENIYVICLNDIKKRNHCNIVVFILFMKF